MEMCLAETWKWLYNFAKILITMTAEHVQILTHYRVPVIDIHAKLGSIVNI